VLYVMAYPQATPTMGMMLGTKAFVAAVLGGIGSIPGAVVGAMLVGFSEVFVSAIGLSVWRDAVVFLLLIIVLIVRPTGIFGRTMSEKV
ncbi:MAG TPA: branched-chain amino acid ABC transporter permease, partial [Candidatus Olsenella pullicola]|nr:branched-chain amino acid ABC transporter permease [Candidatus Olsenella pullicola]